MTGINRRPPLRFRLGTFLLIVAIAALLLLVVVQQVQIGRLSQIIDAQARDAAELTHVIRDLRERLDHSSEPGQPSVRSQVRSGIRPLDQAGPSAGDR